MENGKIVVGVDLDAVDFLSHPQVAAGQIYFERLAIVPLSAVRFNRHLASPMVNLLEEAKLLDGGQLFVRWNCHTHSVIVCRAADVNGEYMPFKPSVSDQVEFESAFDSAMANFIFAVAGADKDLTKIASRRWVMHLSGSHFNHFVFSSQIYGEVVRISRIENHRRAAWDALVEYRNSQFGKGLPAPIVQRQIVSTGRERSDIRKILDLQNKAVIGSDLAPAT